jgi:hypothetical protein
MKEDVDARDNKPGHDDGEAWPYATAFSLSLMSVNARPGARSRV